MIEMQDELYKHIGTYVESYQSTLDAHREWLESNPWLDPKLDGNLTLFCKKCEAIFGPRLALSKVNATYDEWLDVIRVMQHRSLQEYDSELGNALRNYYDSGETALDAYILMWL